MKKQSVLTILKYVFLYGYALLIIFPLLFILISSFKDNEGIFTDPWGLPAVFHWETYMQLFTRYAMGMNFVNSFYYSTAGCILSLLVCITAAYAISRMKWKYNKAVMGFFLLGLMIPAHSTIIPLYISAFKVGVRDPRISLVLIFAAFSIPTTVYILSGFMKSLPREMEEAAIIDGCTIPGALLRIIIPLLKPAIATVTIFTFLAIWNDLLFSLIFINNEKHNNLQLAITKFQGSYGSKYGSLLSAIVVSIIPTIIVYVLLQDKIVKGMTAGAVKG